MALYAVVLTTAVLWGSPRVSSDRTTLWLKLPPEFSPLTIRQLQSELQRIIEPTGLEVQWRSLQAAGQVVDGTSIVVRMFGVCAPGSASGAGRLEPGAWTHRSDGTLLPFVDIDCNRVWLVVEADLRNESAFLREFQLGRALGRVLAHELHHVLAQTSDHGSHGLTKARLGSGELIAGQPSLQESDLRPQVHLTTGPRPSAEPIVRAAVPRKDQRGLTTAGSSGVSPEHTLLQEESSISAR